MSPLLKTQKVTDKRLQAIKYLKEFFILNYKVQGDEENIVPVGSRPATSGRRQWQWQCQLAVGSALIGGRLALSAVEGRLWQGQWQCIDWR